jgi:hypothetical protein
MEASVLIFCTVKDLDLPMMQMVATARRTFQQAAESFYILFKFKFHEVLLVTRLAYCMKMVSAPKRGNAHR